MKYEVKMITLILLLFIGVYVGNAQNENTFIDDIIEYESNKEHPFGKPNVNAPQEIRDFDKLIGGVCLISGLSDGSHN